MKTTFVKQNRCKLMFLRRVWGVIARRWTESNAPPEKAPSALEQKTAQSFYSKSRIVASFLKEWTAIKRLILFSLRARVPSARDRSRQRAESLPRQDAA